MNTVCQSCGESIAAGEQVIRVQYGRLGFTAHPHAKITRAKDHPDDYWHASPECAVNVAVTSAEAV